MSHHDPKRERTILIVGLCLFVVVAIIASAQVARKADRGGTAIVRWRPQAEALLRGENVYVPGAGALPVDEEDEDEANPDNAYPNTPILTLVIYPLMLLPPTASAVAWVWLKWAMLLLVIWWSVRMAAGPRSPPQGLYVLVGLLAIKPLFGDMTHGNVNTLVLFVATAGLYLCSRGRDVAGGAMVALATALKLTPAMFLVYFLWKRQWRAVGGFAAGLLLFLVIIPGLFIGMGTNLRMLDAWRNAMIEPYVQELYVETIQANQSLPGLVHRFLTDQPAVALSGDRTRNINPISLTPQQAQHVVRACVVVLGLAIAWITWPGRLRDNWRLAAEYSLIFIAMLIISERSWKHHYVTVVLPFAVVATHLTLGNPTRAQRRWLLAALIATQVLFYSTSREATGWLVRVDGSTAGHKYVQAFGVYLWAIVILFIANAWIRMRAAPRLPEPAVTSPEPDEPMAAQPAAAAQQPA